jgi:hypothetical protein
VGRRYNRRLGVAEIEEQKKRIIIEKGVEVDVVEADAVEADAVEADVVEVEADVVEADEIRKLRKHILS